MTYLQRINRRRAPQWAPIPGTNQVRTSAGGFAWAIDEWAGLRRFLILGSKDGSHHAGEWRLTRENAEAVEECLTADGARAVAEIVAISEGGRAPKQCPDDVVRTVSNLPFGGTDCALPMLYALAYDREVDVFLTLTDSETWAGDIHPAQALAEYRRASGIDARLVTVAMVSNGFSIADPNDPGQLDVVGFDTATPQLITDFARGVL